MMSEKPIVFGATGFVGKHLIKEIGLTHCIPVSRTHQANQYGLTADLLSLPSLQSILQPGMTVINLAYSHELTPENNIKMAQNLVTACREAKVAKIVHCSTAVVVGGHLALKVNEETLCHPQTIYEKTKYEIEKIFLSALEDINVAILRPTAVVGAEGQNLKKLLMEIRNGHPISNWARSSLYGKRQLNLVSVKDVVKALMHLSDKLTLANGVFICSADHDPDNRYDKVEFLMRTVLNKHSMIKSMHLPIFLLNRLLKMSRAGCGQLANRFYLSDKLLSTGFQFSTSISQAVIDFVKFELANDR